MVVSESGGGVLPDHPPHLFFHANFLHSGSISIILVPLKREDAARANEIDRFFDKIILGGMPARFRHNGAKSRHL